MVIVRRMAGRRVCKSCGRFNGYNSAKQEGICDSCGAHIIRDDEEETVLERLRRTRKTAPRWFYEAEGCSILTEQGKFRRPPGDPGAIGNRENKHDYHKIRA